ncbi:PDZ domain-containing protein sprite [Aphomia sociella]
MSAVMSTLSMISGGRRAHRKLASSGRKSGQFSDVGEDTHRRQNELKQQRSASLQTLETGGGGVVNLESLEAKMASIEVSLAGSRRRSAGARDLSREMDALRAALTDKDTLIQNLKKQLSASLSAARLAASAGTPPASRASTEEHAATLSAEERRALEERAAAVRGDLETKRTNIQELRKRLDKTHVTDNIDTRIQQAELQYKLGREELELLTLGEQARALAQLIEQADAAAKRNDRITLHSTVRECGGSATLVATDAREGSWGAALRGSGVAIEWAGDNAALRPGDRVLEVNGTWMVSCRSQEEVQRAASAATPARLVVLRGYPTQPQQPPAHPNTFTQNEAGSLRAELNALRTASEETERAKESLRTDNTRLTHRISYLEEQVAEMLARHAQVQPTSSNDSCITVNKSKKNVTNINITTEPLTKTKHNPKSEVQVFQKGPDITAIVAKLPGLDGAEANLPLMRPRSNASGASSRTAISPRASPPPNYRSHSSHSLEHKAGRMRHSLSHHCIHGGIDYSAETDAAIRMIERNQRHMEKQRLKSEKLSRNKTEEYFRSDSDLDIKDSRVSIGTCDPKHYEIKKAADRIEESIKKTNWAERKTLSIIEQLKRSQRLRKMKKNDSAEDIQLESEKHYMYHRIDGKVLENAHKSSRRSSKLHCRSAKSSEFESECSDYPNGDIYSSSPRIDYGSESCSRMSHYRKNDDRRDSDVKSRPTPPRKPLRLSLHKARSAHSLINGSESETPSRPPSELQNGDVPDSQKRPVKRTHGADKWARERIRDPGRATPRPIRKLMNGLSACETPAADALYPENTHKPMKVKSVMQSTGKWC